MPQTVFYTLYINGKEHIPFILLLDGTQLLKAKISPYAVSRLKCAVRKSGWGVNPHWLKTYVFGSGKCAPIFGLTNDPYFSRLLKYVSRLRVCPSSGTTLVPSSQD